MNDGWIRIHRQIIEWEWFEDDKLFKLFIYLLLMANHKDKKWRGIDIKRGEHLTSVDKISKKINSTPMRVRTMLKRLKLTNEITIKTTNKYSIIKLNNYDTYQATNKQNNSQLTNNQQTTNKQLTTNNNDNNDNNDNNIFIEKNFSKIIENWNSIKSTRTHKNTSISIDDFIMRKHRKTSDELRSALVKIYKDYSNEDIEKAIKNYSLEIVNRKPSENNNYHEHRYTLEEFMTNDKGFKKYLNY